MIVALSVVFGLLVVIFTVVLRALQPPEDDIPSLGLIDTLNIVLRLSSHAAWQLTEPIIHKYKVMRTINFGQWVVRISSPEAIDTILKDTETYYKMEIQPTLINTILSQFSFLNLNFNNGQAWDQHKQKIGLPLLHMCHKISIFYDLKEMLFCMLEKEQEVDVLECTKQLTIDSLGRLLLGVELGSLNGNNTSFVHIFHPQKDKFCAMLDPLLPLIEPQEVQGQEAIDNFFKQILDDRKAVLDKRENMNDILSLLLKKTPDMSDQEIINDIRVLFITGCDTTSFAMSITLFLLAKYPDLQKKIHDEIISISGTHMPNNDELDSMKHLEAFILETLRLHPPCTIIPPRFTTKDVTLCSFNIPRGAVLVPDLKAMLSDAEYWPNPTQFNLDRFLSQSSSLFLPFGGSEATYMGFGFGFQLQRTIICAILQKYEIQLSRATELEFHPSFLTRPKPFNLKFCPRSHDLEECISAAG
ncbi:RNA polymerase C-22 sterol desaturase [Entomophthora muscae]|uniref:RNA polymerase C-22 sterol desaturase n=1 Tax=Entomophthora muscae TaxID=34485 RepID=A0ACC2S5Z4_9FUNG|nr:RNA polymerase C-22 sterol desaturase [Entomophthora muscae]